MGDTRGKATSGQQPCGQSPPEESGHQNSLSSPESMGHWAVIYCISPPAGGKGEKGPRA